MHPFGGKFFQLAGICLLALLIQTPGAALADQATLADCPPSPNCVSSLAGNDEQKVDPLPGLGSRQASMDLLERVIKAQPRTTWTRLSPARAEATFTTAIMRFTDDVSFHVREDGSIDVRSASRVGHWDLGANRRRVERLREELADHAGHP